MPIVSPASKSFGKGLLTVDSLTLSFEICLLYPALFPVRAITSPKG